MGGVGAAWRLATSTRRRGIRTSPPLSSPPGSRQSWEGVGATRPRRRTEDRRSVGSRVRLDWTGRRGRGTRAERVQDGEDRRVGWLRRRVGDRSQRANAGRRTGRARTTGLSFAPPAARADSLEHRTLLIRGSTSFLLFPSPRRLERSSRRTSRRSTSRPYRESGTANGWAKRGSSTREASKSAVMALAIPPSMASTRGRPRPPPPPATPSLLPNAVAIPALLLPPTPPQRPLLLARTPPPTRLPPLPPPASLDPPFRRSTPISLLPATRPSTPSRRHLSRSCSSA